MTTLTQKTQAQTDEHREDQLDQGLEESFPASDPVSIVTSQEEEDWGAEPAPPAPPAKNVPGG